MNGRVYWKCTAGLFVLFAGLTVVYLHRVPGLMGDEASEGENVYEILHVKPLTVVGERSYIGPVSDYLRVPFLLLFGYTAASLRAVVLVFSWLTFWLLACVLYRVFSENQALMGLVFVVFSPMYLTQERLGWAISLLPFYAVSIPSVLLLQWRYRWLTAGLLAGLGVATHILFLPTAAGVAAAAMLHFMLQLRGGRLVVRRAAAAFLLAAIGFWAGFGSQFAVLRLLTDDQGKPEAVAAALPDRLAALPELAVYLLSGSSYISRYTGLEMTAVARAVITATIGGLALIGTVVCLRRRGGQLFLAGVLVHAGVLLFMIDRFTLRYFVTFVLAVWLLAGLGTGWILGLVARSRFVPNGRGHAFAAASVAVGLGVWFAVGVLIPFLRTGGSTADFSLANRTDSAAALVDVRPLLACLSEAGPVYTENVHIWNRLQYVSHGRRDIQVLTESDAAAAKWLVHYREPAGERGAEDCTAASAERCPELKHFCVLPVK